MRASREAGRMDLRPDFVDAGEFNRALEGNPRILHIK
jgi:hypothetical protein